MLASIQQLFFVRSLCLSIAAELFFFCRGEPTTPAQHEDTRIIELFTCCCHRSHPSLLVVAERAIGNGKNGSATPDEDDDDDDANDDGDILDTDDGYTFTVRMPWFAYWLRVDDILELSSE